MFREMILAFLGYNNGITTIHIGVRPNVESHPNMSYCCTIVVHWKCFNHFSYVYALFVFITRERKIILIID
jgi:hypothetical protein